MLRYTVAFLLASITASLTAQPSFEGFTKTGKGAWYKIVNPHDGRQPALGDYVKIHLKHATWRDSVIFSTYNPNIGAVEFKLAEGNDVSHILPFMHEGDSAICFISADTLYTIAMPPYARKGDWMKFTVKLIDTWTQAEYDAAKEAAKHKQIADQGRQIEEYLVGHGITNYRKTASGVYYVIDKEGTGPTAIPGQTIGVHYTGTLMNGQKFDSSRDRGQPFSFVLGKGHVIKGWDDGLLAFNQGSRGRLFIPSPLAYGENGNGMIPPNSILFFDIEVVSISSESLVLQADAEIINQYLAKNSITANKASSGVFYKIDRPGTGANAAPDQGLLLHYNAYLLNGTKFESTYDSGAPRTCQLGRSTLPKGLELGLRYFNKGAKGRIWIPSPLAYGEKGLPPKIPANAILMYEIEVVDVE